MRPERADAPQRDVGADRLLDAQRPVSDLDQAGGHVQAVGVEFLVGRRPTTRDDRRDERGVLHDLDARAQRRAPGAERAGERGAETPVLLGRHPRPIDPGAELQPPAIERRLLVDEGGEAARRVLGKEALVAQRREIEVDRLHADRTVEGPEPRMRRVDTRLETLAAKDRARLLALELGVLVVEIAARSLSVLNAPVGTSRSAAISTRICFIRIVTSSSATAP
ncbi:MAG: hypothetical protein U1F51_08560 [Burkholderiales bacterium]